MKLLDTTFLIHYWGGVEETAEYLAAHDEETFVTTTLNVKEIAVGRALQGKLDRNEIRSTFDWLTVLPFEREHAYVAGELEARLRRDEEINQDGLNALAADLLIAAVADSENATVVTRNIEDFEQIGVAVEGY